MSDIEWPKEVKSDTHPGDRHPDHDDWGEEEDYDEYDGQPDELTEWMDFDPDC